MSKKHGLLILLMSLALVFSSVTVAFGEASLRVSGGGSVTKGSTVTITCVYTAETVGVGAANISYNSSVLQYTGYSGAVAPSSASGVIAVSFGDGMQSSSRTFSIRFKALEAGSSNVSVSTTDLVDYDGNPLKCPSGSTTVTVTNPAPQVSSNANLSSLKVSAGSLSPAFSAGRTSYTVNVDEDVTVCTISASAADSDAKVSVSGSKNLTPCLLGS